MKINEGIAICSATEPRLLLVPYCEHHVETYHQWMKDPELRELTASEPLSLGEEYAMQRNWRTDKDKLTFIVCLTNKDFKSETDVVAKEDDLPNYMIGDVNLFLFEEDRGDDQKRSGATIGSTASKNVIGEVEIMIARSSTWGRGVGYRALSMFLQYVLDHRQGILRECSRQPSNLAYLRAKIDAQNERSIALFKKAGFVKVLEEPNYFGEVEMRWDVDGLGPNGSMSAGQHKDRDSSETLILRYVMR